MDPSATYTLSQGGHQYGPFTLEQLRDHVSQGSIQPTDLIWCPGMATWDSVREVLGWAAAPAPVNVETPLASPSTPAPVPRSESVAAYPKPPSLHWGLVLMFTVLTLGLFGLVWMFVHAAWVKHIDPTCNALYVLAVGIPLELFLGFAGRAEGLASLVGLIAVTWAYFWMHGAMEKRFGLNLSFVMTLFFNMLYLQYHMTEIADRADAARWQRLQV